MAGGGMKILGLFKVSRGESLDRIYLLKLFGFGVFLHHIHGDDPKGLYHNHPWNGLSLIFGQYTEFFRPFKRPVEMISINGRDRLTTLSEKVYPQRKRWFWNWVDAHRHHRVEVSRPTWTLFIHGRKCNTWEIVDEHGNKTEKPWEGAEGEKSYSKSASTSGTSGTVRRAAA